jgi:hypothetical protein
VCALLSPLSQNAVLRTNGEIGQTRGLLNQLHFLAVKPLAVNITSHRDRDSLSPFALPLHHTV